MITGLGTEIPTGEAASSEVEQRLGLAPGWIEQRTGIKTRRIAAPDEATSDLAVAAGRKALDDAALDPGMVGLVLLATSTPDHLLPPTAPAVAHRLGAFAAGAIDLAGACAGFVYALVLGHAHAQATRTPVLVIAANVLSRRTDPNDAATNALFGDGAGAVVIDLRAPAADTSNASSSLRRSLLGSSLGADGAYADAIHIPAGGSRQPITVDAIERGEQFMRVERGALMAHQAISGMAQVGQEAMKAANVTAEDIDLWVPHQAGRRIIAGARELLGFDEDRTVDVVAELGNSSAATIPIALGIARDHGRLRPGMTVLLTSVGAGIVRAGAVLAW